MVLSIRYSTIKKKPEAARIEYPAIRATSFVSIVVYLQREQRVFFFTFPTILSRKLILSTMKTRRNR
jgi:plasmid replication initiation protein